MNESEPMMKPRKGNRSYQKQAVTFVLAIECIGRPDYWIRDNRG